MSLTEEREAAVAAAAEGLILGRYRLGRRLGAGGFGAVHEAVDERLERRVAIKVIPAEGAATPERAVREAKAAARLDHPGIVGLYDAGEEDHARYLVSELVDGPTLAALEAGEDLTDRDVLRIGLALCDALEHAHERGVVHRDVKPQNVLVPDHPRTWRGAAKLTDFGVAMLAGDDPLTRTGDVVGTLAYMAPEQASGEIVDERVDLYATALVLYEALAGLNPVRGGSPTETARRIGKPVAPLQRHRPDLPEELSDALATALDPDPELRGTLEDLGDALEDALVWVPDEGGTVLPHPVERPGLLPPVPRGAPRIAHAVLTAAIVACAFGWLGSTAQVPWLAAVAAGLLVAVLPRVGWILTVAGTILVLIVGPAALGGEDGIAAAGSAILLFLAVMPVPLLLAREPRAWSVPILAPLLGLVGVAAAYPAIAGRASRVLERAALGALGAWWLILAEPLVNRTLLLGPVTDAPHGAAAQEGMSIAATAVGETFTAGLPVLLAVWALAAAVLPWLVRGYSLTVDVVMATAWAAGLASATAGLGAWLGGGLPSDEPKGLVAGAVVAGVAAIVGAHVPEPPYSSGDSDE